MTPAGMPARTIALFIDGVIVFVGLGAIVALMTGEAHSSSGHGAGFHLHGGAALVWLVATFAYWIALEHLWGTTVGKRIFSIRVESRDGGRPSIGQSLVRNIFRVVDGFPYVFPYLVGFIAAMSGPERARIGDRVAGTRVVGSVVAAPVTSATG